MDDDLFEVLAAEERRYMRNGWLFVAFLVVLFVVGLVVNR